MQASKQVSFYYVAYAIETNRPHIFRTDNKTFLIRVVRASVTIQTRYKTYNRMFNNVGYRPMLLCKTLLFLLAIFERNEAIEGGTVQVGIDHLTR